MTAARCSAAVFFCLLTGCAGALNPTPSAVPASPTPLIRPTLPPTWTPTFTPSPPPPSPTPTLTPTPSITPTLAAADVCAALWVATNLTTFDGAPVQRFDGDGVLSMVVSIPYRDVTIHYRLMHLFTLQMDGVDFPGGQANGLNYPVSYLPLTGLYGWLLLVNSPQYGSICVQRGLFVVDDLTASTATPAPTLTVTAEATAEATPEATAAP